MNKPVSDQAATSVSDAVLSRRSVRAFLPEAVPQALLETMLEKAARAPSGTNMQPWKTWVLTGTTRERVCDAVCASFDEQSADSRSEIDYYPQQWFEPYLSRRRKVGWDLYGLLGIGKRERERMHEQHRRNFRFFDAPTGLIFTVHRQLATGSWLDYGMYLQNLMLLAREQGLHSCPQAAWADHHRVLRQQLPIADEEIVLCGMALGRADTHAVENSLHTERVALSENVTFLD